MASRFFIIILGVLLVTAHQADAKMLDKFDKMPECGLTFYLDDEKKFEADAANIIAYAPIATNGNSLSVIFNGKPVELPLLKSHLPGPLQEQNDDLPKNKGDFWIRIYGNADLKARFQLKPEPSAIYCPTAQYPDGCEYTLYTGTLMVVTPKLNENYNVTADSGC